ncbi:MAG: histidinol phosphatase [Clostridia bacterium]|nr:histidinol phosphatase [Clostridia bacterium]
MYYYETHLHTKPVSKCARTTVRETLEFYKRIGYEGVFITNHFLDGNIDVDHSLPYEDKISHYFSDYEAGAAMAEEIGIRVFAGVETSYKGTDFLVYGLDKAWYLANPQIMEMKKKDQLAFFMECGALVIQAHPYREAGYIDHIRLFPRSVHGVEIINACRTELENAMAKHYAESYGLIPFAGSDNHGGIAQQNLAGMCSQTPISDEADFVKRILAGEMKLFTMTQQDGTVLSTLCLE